MLTMVPPPDPLLDCMKSDDPQDCAQASGFSGAVWVEWDARDPRTMYLLKHLRYVDRSNLTWRAPAGMAIDGASIPRIMWRVIGSPFVGRYRRASVIHDVHCVLREWPHKQVHRMFRDAMLDDGVHRIKAAIMYQAVKWFGPKW